MFSRLLVASFAFAVVAIAQADTTTITQFNNKSQVNLQKGDTLIVRLQGNPSTGYSWRMVQNNSSLLRPRGGPQFQSYAPGVPGAMGDQVFTFKAVGTGGENLGFLYQGPQAGVQAAQSFNCLVCINRSSGNTVIVTDANNDGNVSLRVGDTLIVRLTANTTTGYSWSVGPGLQGVLQQTGGPVNSRNNSGMMGAGGTQSFTFKAVGGGGGFLRLAYSRSFQGGVGPARTWDILVSVSQGRGGSGLLGSLILGENVR